MSTYTKTLDEIVGQDIFDSREIIDRKNQIESEILTLVELTSDVIEEPLEGELSDELQELEELRDELKQIEEIEAEAYTPDYQYGAVFVREDYFEQYARQYAEDCGAIEEDSRWPNYCIDWERAASDLAMDFTSCTIQGIDYYTR